jgi:hypothetical protein
MKTKILLSTVALFTLTACQSPAPIFQKSEVIETATNTIAVAETVTNEVGAVQVVTNLVQVPVFFTNTVYTVSTQLVAGAEMIRGTGSAVALAAPPAAPIVGVVDGLLGLGLTLLGAFATVKTRLARKQDTALQKSAAMLRAVVVGVEAVNRPEVKESISKHATVLGVTDALDGVVQSITKEATR